MTSCSLQAIHEWDTTLKAAMTWLDMCGPLVILILSQEGRPFQLQASYLELGLDVLGFAMMAMFCPRELACNAFKIPWLHCLASLESKLLVVELESWHVCHVMDLGLFPFKFG
jgi:hypothetical protein